MDAYMRPAKAICVNYERMRLVRVTNKDDGRIYALFNFSVFHDCASAESRPHAKG